MPAAAAVAGRYEVRPSAVIAASHPGSPTSTTTTAGCGPRTWSFALGGDTASGILAGTFGYGDETDGFPEEFEMVEGNGSTYALSISDTLAEEYGGGMGLWLSACLDATAFTGISFWVRGNAPSHARPMLTLLMEETTSIPHLDGHKDAIGTLRGDRRTQADTERLHNLRSSGTPSRDTWARVARPSHIGRDAAANIASSSSTGTRVGGQRRAACTRDPGRYGRRRRRGVLRRRRSTDRDGRGAVANRTDRLLDYPIRPVPFTAVT